MVEQSDTYGPREHRWTTGVMDARITKTSEAEQLALRASERPAG